MTEPSGLLIINKHLGVTSHDIVWKVRKLFGTKRVGHTGTLDPMASGVLVVLVGRAAKAAEYLVADLVADLVDLGVGLVEFSCDHHIFRFYPVGDNAYLFKQAFVYVE